MSGLPLFDKVRARHVEPAIDAVLDEGRRIVDELLEHEQHDWDSLVVPMEKMRHRIDRIWSPVSHLNAVVNTPKLRAAYNACLPKLTRFSTELGQNADLYRAYRKVASGEAQDGPRARLLEQTLRDFRLAGVDLPENERTKFRELVEELSSLQARFEENLLDATNGWEYLIEDEAELAGIPAQARARAGEEAAAKDKKGWLFGLDFPSYFAIAAHADSEALRRRFHEAWVTRASDKGPNAGKWDNGPIMTRILELRQEMAGLLDFDDFTGYSLATKMAESTNEVMDFLHDLTQRSHRLAEQEFAALEAFAGHKLNAWDVAYYSEHLRKDRYDVSDEELRPYFPIDRALAGLFRITETLFGVSIEERKPENAWHDDVRYFEIFDSDGGLRGSFFVDLYARSAKRGGAWMDECIGRIDVDDATEKPVAYLVCNFMPPTGDAPALLTHNDIITLFHEFGHTLHLLLTRVDYPSIAGINGVPWDAVELPSQFMENFAWTKDVLPLVSGHYRSGEPLPEDVFERLLGTRTFQAAMHLARQLEFSLFDMRLHAEYRHGRSVEQIIDDVRREVSVVPVSAQNRFACGFSHVFGGGYAAGYYSYKWAEVLSADAFSAFEEAGTLDDVTGRRFSKAILEVGGSVRAMDAFIEFRGRKPSLEPLLRHMGIDTTPAIADHAS